MDDVLIKKFFSYAFILRFEPPYGMDESFERILILSQSIRFINKAIELRLLKKTTIEELRSRFKIRNIEEDYHKISRLIHESNRLEDEHNFIYNDSKLATQEMKFKQRFRKLYLLLYTSSTGKTLQRSKEQEVFHQLKEFYKKHHNEMGNFRSKTLRSEKETVIQRLKTFRNKLQRLGS